MTMHDPHDDTLEAAGVVLFDGCPRCDEHAESPLRGLDRDHIAVLWQQMVAVEQAPLFSGPSYRSVNEARACRTLYGIAVVLEANTDVDPWRWPLRSKQPPAPEAEAPVRWAGA